MAKSGGRIQERRRDGNRRTVTLCTPRKSRRTQDAAPCNMPLLCDLAKLLGRRNAVLQLMRYSALLLISWLTTGTVFLCGAGAADLLACTNEATREAESRCRPRDICGLIKRRLSRLSVPNGRRRRLALDGHVRKSSQGGTGGVLCTPLPPTQTAVLWDTERICLRCTHCCSNSMSGARTTGVATREKAVPRIPEVQYCCRQAASRAAAFPTPRVRHADGGPFVDPSPRACARAFRSSTAHYYDYSADVCRLPMLT